MFWQCSEPCVSTAPSPGVASPCSSSAAPAAELAEKSAGGGDSLGETQPGDIGELPQNMGVETEAPTTTTETLHVDENSHAPLADGDGTAGAADKAMPMEHFPTQVPEGYVNQSKVPNVLSPRI